MDSKTVGNARAFYTLDLVTFDKNGASSFLPILGSLLDRFGGEIRVLSSKGRKAFRSEVSFSRACAKKPQLNRAIFHPAVGGDYGIPGVIGMTTALSLSPSDTLWDDLQQLDLFALGRAGSPELLKMRRLQMEARNLTPTIFIIQAALGRALIRREILSVTTAMLAHLCEVQFPTDTKFYGRAHPSFYDEPLFYRAFSVTHDHAELREKFLCATPILGCSRRESEKLGEDSRLQDLDYGEVSFGFGEFVIFDASDASERLVQSGRAISRYIPFRPIGCDFSVE